MKLTNENVLMASLLGSNVVEKLPRFETIQNELSKHVLPPINFLPVRSSNANVSEIRNDRDFEIWVEENEISKERQFFPFSFRSSKDENFWLLPWEPMINISASNIIAKRRVAKAGKNQIGSIKERFSTDDYEITISGAFIGRKMTGKPADTYPRYEMEKLRDYLLAAESIQILCEPLQILGINYIVIESVSFPFTKGENVQAYEIKAVSDFPYSLIYERRKATLDVGIVESGEKLQ